MLSLSGSVWWVPFQGMQENSLEVLGKYLLIGVVVAAGLGLAGCGLWCLWNGACSWKWPTVTGIILHSDIEAEGSDEDASYRLRSLYRYQIGGQEYMGKRVYFGQAVLWTSSFDRLLRRTMRYHPGNPVQVYIHQTKPKRCVLQPGTSLEAWTATILGFALCGGLLIALLKTQASPL
jgi:hypothetical protein